MEYGRDNIRDGLFAELAAEGRRLGIIRPHTDAERAESRARILAGIEPDEDIWVFGYGSLMWNPAFHYLERRPALLHGWHRSFCLWTPLGRGSPDAPGLVLGLDRGGSCCGIAYRIAAADRDTELALLWQREMVADGYTPRWAAVRCREGIARDHLGDQSRGQALCRQAAAGDRGADRGDGVRKAGPQQGLS